MTFRFDGRDLVPDMTNTLNLALGLGEKIQDRRDQKELAGLTQQVGEFDSTQDLLQNPESVKILSRMGQLNPQAAQLAMQVMASKDSAQAQSLAQEAEEGKRFYQALINTPKEARKGLISRHAKKLQAEGKDISKLTEIMSLTPQEQEIRARQNLILAGDMSSVANMSLKDQMQLQKTQLDMLKTQQDMQINQQKAIAAEQDRQSKIEEKEQQKALADESQQISANIVLDLVKQARDLNDEASSGRMATVSEFLSPTGSTARFSDVVESLESKISLDTLINMKKQGASLGGTSERELQMLGVNLGKLKTRQRPEDRKKTLDTIEKVYSKIVNSDDFTSNPEIAKAGTIGVEERANTVDFGSLRRDF